MRDVKVEKAFFNLLNDIEKYNDGLMTKQMIKAQINLFEVMARNSDDVFEDFIEDIRELI
ncbi:MAG: hypothetical protein ACQESP_12465 [Candidatus Muiribacteriota bacterium]